MEKRWSISPECPPPSPISILTKLQSLGFCSRVDVASDGGEASEFDRILEVFMKEVDRRKKILPFPPSLRNGQSVDLLKLYRAVEEKGGFSSVSTRRSWESVAEEIGLDATTGSSLKLIYFKYLGSLNPFLRKVLGEELSGSKESLSSSVGESEAEAKNFRGQLVSDQEDCVSPVSLGYGANGFSTPVRGNAGTTRADDRGNENDDLVVLDPVMANEVFSSLKRKRESMVETLNWVLRVAKNPGHPSVGCVSSGKVKGKDCGVGELMSHALTARKMMFLKKDSGINGDGSISQKRHKVHPSIYEDNNGLDANGNQKFRCSERIQLLTRHAHLISCSEVTTTGDKDLRTVAADGNHERRTVRKSSLIRDGAAGLLSRDPLQKRIPVGSYFQVKVPEWTVITSGESDDQKWLGTRIWPVESKGQKRLIGKVPVGKGRDSKCVCQSPGSVDCIRFHVAEKRLQLKHELGPAFDNWGFNVMGEEVSLSWTKDEERRFKAIVRLNPPSLNKNFWDHLHLAFPSKGRQNLVNYYFNVFLLRRRSYQNSVTPSSVNSDDEDIDHGFLSRPFSQDAIKVQDPKSFSCARNALYVDLSNCSDTS